MSKYTGIVLADIHVGAMNLEKLFDEYKRLVIDKINEMESLDFVIICGDFFDHKFYLQDNNSIYSYKMLNMLIDVCRQKHTKIRIVYGTESHECNQYDMLSLLKLYDDIKVIKFVEEEYLFDDLKVLYLPEEHIFDKNDYYKEYFNKVNEYDYIFGHGVIKEGMTEAAIHIENKSDSSKRKRVPVFTSGELSRICKGQVYFGHYHINVKIDDKVFYIGSFSRWKFGEEGRKGYYILNCNTKKDIYENTYVENTLADPYISVFIGYEDDMYKNDISNMIESLDNISNRNDLDHLRFVFNIPENMDNPEATINLIKEKYKYNDNVKIDIVHGYIEDKRKHEKSRIQKENEKYNFIFDNSIPIEEKVSTFISIEYNKNIRPETIYKYMNEQLSEILEENNDNDIT